MLIRYKTGPNGKPIKAALLYTEAEHNISQALVDSDAVKIVERLVSRGYVAYIVGGAVRDLLLSHKPKDYDIVTNAEPNQIRKLFFRARIIGKRFRLVHVYVGGKIFEVSTFRSIANGTVGNTYGTIDEDALRRDFTLNALYFDPLQSQVLDYVGGLNDIKAHKLTNVIPLKTIFVEDPVRMIRAIKYSALTGFRIPFMMSLAIRRNSQLIKKASISRLGEETMKIFYSGQALAIIENLSKYKLLPTILPNLQSLLNSAEAKKIKKDISELDAYVKKTSTKTLSAILPFILRSTIESVKLQGAESQQELYKNALAASRQFLLPLTLPRVELEKAVKSFFVQPKPKPKPKQKNFTRAKPAKPKIVKNL